METIRNGMCPEFDTWAEYDAWVKNRHITRKEEQGIEMRTAHDGMVGVNDAVLQRAPVTGIS